MPDVDLMSYDGALLALLEMEGSTDRAQFVAAAADLSSSLDCATPENEQTASAWLADAEQRRLVRVDSHDDLVTISPNGRDRLVGLL